MPEFRNMIIPVNLRVSAEKYVALHMELAVIQHEKYGEIRICLNIGNGSTFVRFPDDTTYILNLSDLMDSVLVLKDKMKEETP